MQLNDSHIIKQKHYIRMDKMSLTDDSSKHHMIGGDGPHSYLRNSGYQKQLVVSVKELMQEVINKHLDTCVSTFQIADFGCSVGGNTFISVENIVTAVENRYKSKKITPPQFHIFFNDLIQNDFNTLFKNIPSSFSKHFVAAAPGSFHGRLFPKKTIHFAHCSTALHWISRIPHEVTDTSSKAWNKSRVHYSGAGKQVKNAYSAQYNRDMNVFLNARAEEIVHGGVMALVLLGFPDEYVLSSDSSIGVALDILGSSLLDMAKMGKVREERVDCFNLPFYYPCPSEVKALIEENGMFSVERMAELGGPMRGKPDAHVLTRHLRAVIGVLVEDHFGSGIVDELFNMHLDKLITSPILVDDKYWKETSFFVFLKRKPSFNLS